MESCESSREMRTGRSVMTRGWPFVMAAYALAITWPAAAKEFDRIEGPELAGLVRSKDARPQTRLTLVELEALPNVLRDNRSALIVATTSQGNYARLLVSQALRKPPEGAGKPIPVLLLERFD